MTDPSLADLIRASGLPQNMLVADLPDLTWHVNRPLVSYWEISTLGQLAQLTDDEVRDLPGIGERRLAALKAAVRRATPQAVPDLRQRCADRLLAKDAESWGYGTFEGDRDAAFAVVDEVLALCDDELATAVRRAEQAEAERDELRAVVERDITIDSWLYRRVERAEADALTAREALMAREKEPHAEAKELLGEQGGSGNG
ncbi:hypothetical protein [Microbispora sp. CA-102843]|uniref:hypothetical protein n=1 Tax=Microbispora sp. CA-102843 TaxID=3239952 RepID=UPI003D92D718